jgi:hypothetical protein
VYYRHSSYFLTQGGHILVCSPILDGDEDIPLVMSELFRIQEGGAMTSSLSPLATSCHPTGNY